MKTTPYLIRHATTDEINDWDQRILTNPDGGDPFQLRALADVKQIQGWKSEFWVFEASFGVVYSLALIRNVPGLGRFVYIPRGPGVVSMEQFEELTELLKTSALPRAFAVKCEPPILKHEEPHRALAGTVVARPIQPNVHTVHVDLARSEDAILASFRQRARREIRAAEKEGVKIRAVDVNDTTINQMYELYAETAGRAGFFLRPKTYNARFWRDFSARGSGKLFLAYGPDDAMPVAGAFVCYSAAIGVYKDGGSRRSGVKHFAHLLQWEIMRALRADGVTSYDLHGVPPQDKLEDPTHPLAGLAMFKLSFTQQTTEYVGAFDVVLDARKYAVWQKIGQRAYHAFAHRVHKTTFY